MQQLGATDAADVEVGYQHHTTVGNTRSTPKTMFARRGPVSVAIEQFHWDELKHRGAREVAE